MEKDLNITLCLGSSCYSRGSKDVVYAVQEYLEDKGIKDKVKFKGGHCFGHCKEGPVMIINGETYDNIDPDKAIEILEDILD